MHRELLGELLHAGGHAGGPHARDARHHRRPRRGLADGSQQRVLFQGFHQGRLAGAAAGHETAHAAGAQMLQQALQGLVVYGLVPEGGDQGDPEAAIGGMAIGARGGR